MIRPKHAAKKKKAVAGSRLTKGGATRERIREAVIRLVSRRGLNSIILQDICDEAGITHGGFYFHFSRKEDAMLDVAKEWAENFKKKVLETPYLDDFYEEIYQMILTYIVGYTESIAVTRLVYSLDPNYEELRATYGRYQKRWWARLEELFIRTRRRAGLANGMEIWIVHAMTAALEGVCVNAYLLAPSNLPDDGADHERTAERVAVIWHRAVLGADPDTKRLKLVRAKAV